MKEKIIVEFEDLDDESAKWQAWGFGIYKWNDRQDLNRQWRELIHGAPQAFKETNE